MNTAKPSFIIVLIGAFFLGASTPLSADFVSMVKMCESCHGKDGISVEPEVPIIAGFSYEGFLNTIYPALLKKKRKEWRHQETLCAVWCFPSFV